MRRIADQRDARRVVGHDGDLNRAGVDAVIGDDGQGVRAERDIAVGNTVGQRGVGTHQRPVQIKAGAGDGAGGQGGDGKIGAFHNALGVRRTGYCNSRRRQRTAAGGDHEVINLAKRVRCARPIVIGQQNVKRCAGQPGGVDAGGDRAAGGGGHQAHPTPGGSGEVTNFLVKISIKDRDAKLRPGMSATVDIETQTVENVVAVPIQSVTVRAAGGKTTEELQEAKAKEVKERSGNDLEITKERDEAKRNRDSLLRVVFIKSGDTVKQRVVETGIADNSSIEVKKGQSRENILGRLESRLRRQQGVMPPGWRQALTVWQPLYACCRRST